MYLYKHTTRFYPSLDPHSKSPKPNPFLFLPPPPPLKSWNEPFRNETFPTRKSQTSSQLQPLARLSIRPMKNNQQPSSLLVGGDKNVVVVRARGRRHGEKERRGEELAERGEDFEASAGLGKLTQIG